MLQSAPYSSSYSWRLRQARVLGGHGVPGTWFAQVGLGGARCRAQAAGGLFLAPRPAKPSIDWGRVAQPLPQHLPEGRALYLRRQTGCDSLGACAFRKSEILDTGFDAVHASVGRQRRPIRRLCPRLSLGGCQRRPGGQVQFSSRQRCAHRTSPSVDRHRRNASLPQTCIVAQQRAAGPSYQCPVGT